MALKEKMKAYQMDILLFPEEDTENAKAIAEALIGTYIDF